MNSSLIFNQKQRCQDVSILKPFYRCILTNISILSLLIDLYLSKYKSVNIDQYSLIVVSLNTLGNDSNIDFIELQSNIIKPMMIQQCLMSNVMNQCNNKMQHRIKFKLIAVQKIPIILS